MYKEDFEEETGESVIAVVAVVIAAVAMLIAIGAYSRAGGSITEEAQDTFETAGERIEETAEDVSEEIDETTNEANMEAQEQAALASLREVKEDIESQNITDDTYNNVTSAREDLQDAYINDSQMMSTWTTDFNNLEQMLNTNNTSEALTIVNNMITKLES